MLMTFKISFLIIIFFILLCFYSKMIIWWIFFISGFVSYEITGHFMDLKEEKISMEEPLL